MTIPLGSEFGGMGISNYQNTAIGQVVVLAYIDAYTKLVSDMGGLSANAKADAPAQAVTLSRPGVLRVSAKGSGSGARFTAIWGTREDHDARTWRMTGSPGIAAIDDEVKAIMSAGIEQFLPLERHRA